MSGTTQLAPRPIKAFAFDLDDTLFFERDYVLSGFGHIARLTAESVGRPADEIGAFLNECFVRGVRGNSFDVLVARFPSIGTRWTVQQLVEEYRNHVPLLTLDSAVDCLLQSLQNNGAKVAILTDGPPASQKAKCKGLGLDSIADLTIFNDEFGVEFRKPHERGFHAIASTFGFPPEACVYVGDNPSKDFYAPRRLGWHSIRFRVPRQLRFHLEPVSVAYSSDAEITSRRRLAEYLEACAALGRDLSLR